MVNAVVFYRMERWLHVHHIPILPKLIQLLIFLIYNSKITPDTKIGKGSFFICNGVSCVLHAGTIIGENTRLGIHLVIVGQGPYRDVAVIGNNVWIGPNVTIQGPVVIDDGVVIAPGSVVNKSIPKNAIVAGVPAKIIGWTDQLRYDLFKNENWKTGKMPYLKEK